MVVSAPVLIPDEGGDNRQWRRKPRAGRRRLGRNANLASPVDKRGPTWPPFQFLPSGHLRTIPHAYAPHDIPLLNLIDDFHAGDDAAENRVLGVEVRLRRVPD